MTQLDDEIQSLRDEIDAGREVLDDLTIELMEKLMELEDKVKVRDLLEDVE